RTQVPADTMSRAVKTIRGSQESQLTVGLVHVVFRLQPDTPSARQTPESPKQQVVRRSKTLQSHYHRPQRRYLSLQNANLAVRDSYHSQRLRQAPSLTVQ